MCSRISRYQQRIYNFIESRSPYSTLVKDQNNKNIFGTNDHESSLMLLSIFNGLRKEKKFKSHDAYYIAAGTDLLMVISMIRDNFEYYKFKYGDNNINNIVSQAPAYVFECLSKNLESMSHIVEKDKIVKIQSKIYAYFNQKMLVITKTENIQPTEKPKKTDIIRYRFNNNNIINLKYKKLKIFNKESLITYVNNKYGAVCQCAFVIGWMLGTGDDKQIPQLEELGKHFGMVIKLSNDFKNLESDIENSRGFTYNMIVNYGIHNCFAMFDESKLKILEICISLNIYSTVVKETVDYIEKKFETYLKNTDLELNSVYTSFSDA
jgi:hypothetical protein